MTDVIDVEATDLIPVEQPQSVMVPHNLGGLPYLQDFSRLADAICKTEMVPDALRNRPDAVLAVFMAGFELGVGPIQALQGINMIKGKPSMGAEMMRALILNAGHQFRVTASNTEATVRCHRKDWPAEEWDTFTYTMDDAKSAGLAGGDNYKKRPRAMLTARVTSEAARAVFSDVIAGLSYTPDEVEEFAPIPQGLSAPGEVAVIEAQAATHPEPAGPDPLADESMKALTALIAEFPDVERPTIASHLRGRFGPSKDMTLDQINEAIDVVAGWPDTAKPNEQPSLEGAEF